MSKRDCNVSGLLRNLGISESGYYQHQRSKQGQTETEKRRIMVKNLILMIYYESKQIYGAPPKKKKKLCRAA